MRFAAEAERGELMTTPDRFRDIEFGASAFYRIVVQGTLRPDWSDRLAGLAITTTSQGDRAPHTALVGKIRDQAELSGVLDTLYGLHLPILKVEQVEEESTATPATPMPIGASTDLRKK